MGTCVGTRTGGGGLFCGGNVMLSAGVSLGVVMLSGGTTTVASVGPSHSCGQPVGPPWYSLPEYVSSDTHCVVGVVHVQPPSVVGIWSMAGGVATVVAAVPPALLHWSVKATSAGGDVTGTGLPWQLPISSSNPPGVRWLR